MRQFIRHPADIPVVIESREGGEAERLQDVGLGGLCLRTGESREPGTLVQVRLPDIAPDLRLPGRVAWCRRVGDGFEIGVAFLGRQTAFRARMVEQIAHIEQYRLDVLLQEGRRLTRREAAEEWIAHHAAEFPAAG